LRAKLASKGDAQINLQFSVLVEICFIHAIDASDFCGNYSAYFCS
jgi:hypothetical protein